MVVAVLSDITYRIQKTARSKPQVVHGDRLKPYSGPELKAWTYILHQSQLSKLSCVAKRVKRVN